MLPIDGSVYNDENLLIEELRIEHLDRYLRFALFRRGNAALQSHDVNRLRQLGAIFRMVHADETYCTKEPIS